MQPGEKTLLGRIALAFILSGSFYVTMDYYMCCHWDTPLFIIASGINVVTTMNWWQKIGQIKLLRGLK